MELADALRSLPQLSALAPTDLEALGRAFEVRDLDASDVLMAVGEPGEEAYLILDGEVAMTTGPPGEVADRADEIGRVSPGTLVGLLGLIDGEVRTATCTATGPTRVAVTTREALAAAASASDAIDLAVELTVAAQVARDFREVAGRVRDLLSAQSPPGTPVKDYDVVVIGAGPMAMMYASWVKNERPQTRIALIERKTTPGYKIGESALGPAHKAFLSVGLTQPVMRRLFQNKNALDFWWTGEGSDALEPHINLTNVDETFHIERSVLEEVMLNVVERRGDIDIYPGTRVSISESRLDRAGSDLVCQGPDGGEVRFRTTLVCDASGPASVIPRHLGLYRKPSDDFNTNAYFGYFREKTPVPLSHWADPSTDHVCCPHGWMWFIRLVSWENTPSENLSAMIDYLLDLPEGPDESYPTRDELCEKFGCTPEYTTSIGIMVRDDLDDSKHLPIEQRFEYYTARYPGIRRVMENYELIERPYEKHRRYSAYMRPAHDCERVAGDGWVAIGDAASFVNALFSIGLSFGSGEAFMAAQDSVRALDAGDVSEERFATYQHYARRAFEELFRENATWYRGFRHPVSFERTMMSKTFYGASLKPAVAPPGTSAIKHYTADDPNYVGILNEPWGAKVAQMYDVLRSAEEAGVDPAVVAEEIRAIVDPFVEELFADVPPPLRERYLYFFSNYDPYGRRVESKEIPTERPLLPWRCGECRRPVDRGLTRCHVCGAAKPPDAELAASPCP